jgi:hypothetical protein
VQIEYVPGRIRKALHMVFVAVASMGGYLWMGNAGAALLCLWGYAAWPGTGVCRLSVQLERIAEVRLYTTAVVVREYGGTPQWIYRDEMPADSYAAFRRTVKQQVQGLL